MKKYLLSLLMLFILLTSCSIQHSNVVEKEVQFQENIEVEVSIDSHKKEYIIDENAMELFEKIYQITNLNKHEVYKTDDKINIVFYFNNEVKRHEISSIREFVLRVFIIKAEMRFTSLPYNDVITSDLNWDKVSLKAYIDNNLVMTESFSNLNSGDMQINYYENMDIQLSSRQFQYPAAKTFSKTIKQRYWGINSIDYQKSYKGNVLVVKVYGSKKYSQKDISKIKSLLEKKLANDLENESKKKHGANIDFLGIVLQMYSGTEKYYEQTYYNGINKKWIDEDWMNYKFY